MRKTTMISNWNRYPTIDARIHSFRTSKELSKLVKVTPQLIARGSGLSYGDASLASVIFSTLHFNKILSFNKEEGIITCESGVTLDELLQVIVPAGWFLPVTPGTKFITTGGAVAADVHGKNHHKEGSFSRYVNKLSLMQANGEIISCSRIENDTIFNFTCGGMGLTGIILDVELRLKKIQTSFISQRNVIASNLQELVDALKENSSYTYSVAWIDCVASKNRLGRSVLMLGEHAAAEELPSSHRSLPLQVHAPPRFNLGGNLPAFVLNQFSISLFNSAYYQWHKRAIKNFFVHYDKFFYPLDFIRNWNRLYGKKGFLQYQFVIPLTHREGLLRDIVKKISDSGLASFLGVLKILGPSEHPLSFGMPGYTLALDFPITRNLFTLLDKLDEIVVASGGKIYLAKDARMKLETFKRSYSRLNYNKYPNPDQQTKFQSLLSKRLAIT